MKRQRINSIDEIFDGTHLKIKDFTNLDLSNLDLSSVPMKEWEDCIFFNTNFHNTGIKFIPIKLKENDKLYKVNMSYCDFSDNDLSFLTKKDFFTAESPYAQIKTHGCNFKNTKVNCLTRLVNMTLDQSYSDFDYEFWDYNYRYYNSTFDRIDILTIIKNPFLKISSYALLDILGDYTQKYIFNCVIECKGRTFKDFKYNEEITKKVVENCEKFLYRYDKQGYAIKLYDEISKEFSYIDKFWFFRKEVQYTNITNADLKDVPFKVWGELYFKGCKFENVTLSGKIKEVTLWGPEHFYDVGYGEWVNKYENVYMPEISESSWREKEASRKRMSDGAITFFTKVYLELSRQCNANCKFCRNETFEKSKYDLEHIIKTLNSVKQYINAVVIGGGEPTLKIEDVKRLKECCDSENIDWHMFTNGTNLSLISKCIIENFKLNISRHAISDTENAQIFGVNTSKMMTYKNIEQLNAQNAEITLNATCFNGGLDNAIKIIEYIEFAKAIGCKKVLIQDLQQNYSLGVKDKNYNNLTINPKEFKKVMEYLLVAGFKQKRYPIIASGGYITEIFKDKEGFSVSIQKYITKQELLNSWPKAIKRAFDLSIDPAGNLYENWHQTSGCLEDFKIN